MFTLSLEGPGARIMAVKFALSAILTLAFLSAGSAMNQSAAVSGLSAKSNGARNSVLVELFTSEGCSSCPPADALLARLDEEQPVPGAEILVLEEHVDYWDQQGWVDPFSGVQWTERQQDYAAVRHDSGVYTPQMVVDGRTELVGSRERQARQAIADAASQTHVQITVTPLSSVKPDEPRFTVSIEKLAASASAERADVWLAVTETGLHSAVRAGENSGVDVHHAAVVRSLRKVGALDSGKDPAFIADVSVKLDRAWKRQNLRVIVFAQERRGRHILGSAAARIQP